MRYELPKIMIGDNKHMKKLRKILCKWYCLDEQENFYADRTLRECVRDCLRNPGPYHDEVIAWEWYSSYSAHGFGDSRHSEKHMSLIVSFRSSQQGCSQHHSFHHRLSSVWLFADLGCDWLLINHHLRGGWYQRAVLKRFTTPPVDACRFVVTIHAFTTKDVVLIDNHHVV